MSTVKNNAEWAVIGAGPAGITAVGKLMDYSIRPDDIAWFDPHFTVGDFGTLWQEVPSNTKVGLFLKFLTASQAFNFSSRETPFGLESLDPKGTCKLANVVEPLQWITNHLIKQVNVFEEKVISIEQQTKGWCLHTNAKKIYAKNVVLATGADAKVLGYSQPQRISLDNAMCPIRIQSQCDARDIVAVFGSSHSAILVLKHLVDMGVKQIINFYQFPLRYAIDMGDAILFDDTGLKGTTAAWAKDNINGTLPKNLSRVLSNEDNVEHYLPQCTKQIHAVGFEQRHQLFIDGVSLTHYHNKTGIIAPGLFGLGIGFPEAKMTPFGFEEYRVGLWKFMDYATRVVPIWLQYPS